MKKTISRAWKSEFVRGGALVTGASFLVNILNYFFNVLAARALGPSGFGEITALFSYTAIFSIPMTVMSLVVINKIGSKGEGARAFAGALQFWFFSKIKRWWYLGIPFILAIPFVPRITNLTMVSGYALLPFIALNFVLSFYNSLIQGLQLFMWVALLGLFTSVIKVSGATLVIAGVDGLATVIIFLLLSVLIPTIAGWALLNKRIVNGIGKQRQTAINKRLSHALINRYVIITFISILALTLFSNVDIIFVKKFFSPYAAGIYGSWSLFAKIILYAMGPISIISFIFFSDKKRERNHEHVQNITLVLLGMVGIGSFIFYKYFSIFIIHLFFGSKFDAVAPYLWAASLFGTFYTTITFLMNYFLAKRNNASLMLFFVMPVYFAALFLIPRTLVNIIMLNVYFSAFVVALYLVAYARLIFYNGPNGKTKD